MSKCFDEFMSKARDCASTTAAGTRLLAFLSKQNILIKLEQEKIRRNYAKLGKVYYKDFITDEEPDDAEYQPLCEEITASYKMINALKDEIEDAKDAYRELVNTPRVSTENSEDVDSDSLEESDTSEEQDVDIIQL